MKNKKKKKINIFKNITTLKKELLNPKIHSNDFTSKKNIYHQSKTFSSKLSHKIEIINNINTEEEENAQEILEQLFREELNKFKIRDNKKEKLKEINLKEENADDLYNWNSLLNRKIPFSMRNEYNANIKKKKFNSFNKIDYNSIDYTKGMNVISQLPNEVLLDFYKDIIKNRKKATQLSPKIKLRNKKNISNVITLHRMLYSDKKKYLNYLTLNEKENNIFTDHDLKITAKRKTADVLIKASIKNNKINENTKEDVNINNNIIKRNSIKEKKKGLILSLYDENCPEIIKFNEEIHSLSEQNKNKIILDVFNELKEDENNHCNGRKILSANNLKSKSILCNSISSDKDGLKDFSSGTTNISVNINEINNKRKTISFFKDENKKKEKNFSLRNNSNNYNKNYKNSLFNTMSSPYLSNSEPDKIYLLKNKFIKKNLSYEEYNTIGFFNCFPRKKSSKVGNSMYDKINKILKFRLLKKFKLNSKQYFKNLITKTINSKYNKNKEETKNNKLIQTFISENLKTNNSRTTDSDMLNSINQYKDNEILFSRKKNNIKLNKKTNTFFSCSNNYIVNIKRKNKQKFLNNFSDFEYLNDMMNEIIFEDKFTQKESTKRIKSVYNHH